MENRFARGVIGLLGVVAVGLAVPAVRHLREVPPPLPPGIRLTLSAPAGVSPGFGDEPLDAAVTPDGRSVALVATSVGTAQLWLRRLAGVEAERLDGTDGAQLPAWNLAGDTLAFFASGRLKTITLATGTVQDLIETPAPAGASWLPDGSILFAGSAGEPIRRIVSGSGAPQPYTTLAPGDRQHVYPFVFGARGDVVYIAVRDNGQRVIRVVVDGETRELGTTSGHAEVAHDHVVHVLDGTLVAEPLARERPRPTNPHPRVPRAVLATGVGVSASGRGLFSTTARVLLYAAPAPRSHQLTWLDLETGARSEIRDPDEYWRVRLSPTDGHVAVTLTESLLRTLDIVSVPTGPLGYLEKVSLALAPDTDAVWSPDAGRIVFRSLQKGRPGLLLRTAHRADATPTALPSGDADFTPTDWRGTRLLAHAVTGKTGADLWDLDEATLTGRAIVASGFNETDGHWSADGRWVAYVSDESGRPDIYATRLLDGVRIRLSFGGGTQPRWGRDGRSVYFLRDGRLMRSDMQDGPSPTPVTARRISELSEIRDFDASRVSNRLLVLVPAARTAAPAVTAVVDWASLLPAQGR